RRDRAAVLGHGAGRPAADLRGGPRQALGHRLRAAYAGSVRGRLMRFGWWHSVTIGVLAALGLVAAGGGRAARPPAAPTVRVVVSVPPGGAIDTLVRVLGDQTGKNNGPTIIVEPRPGAGGIIAAEAVARAAPDGNTLLISTNGMLINAILRKVSFDPLTSFEPICYLVNSPQLIVVKGVSPYRTLPDFLAAARARPRELSVA